MKTIYAKFVLSLLAFSVTSACTGDFEEYNKNPNELEIGKTAPVNLLPNILYSGGSGLLRQTYQMNGELIQYTVSSNTTDAYHRYQISNGVTAGIWDLLARWASNADHMIDLCEDQEEKCNFKAIGLTLRAFYMQMLTDIWGDVPFFEAFEGREGNFKPKFDSQRAIYLQLIADLEEANGLYDNKFPFSSTQKVKDLLYGGDLDKWRRFSNSLLLRILLRVSARDDADLQIATRMQRIFDDPAAWPVFDSEENAAILRFSGESPFLNPYGSMSDTSFSGAGRRACIQLITMLDTFGDPRLSIYFRQNAGMWNGAISGEASRDESGSSEAAYLRKAVLGEYTSPYSFMNYDEVLFIWAEAAQRGLIAGGDALAQEYYAGAVEASIRHWSANPGNSKAVSESAIEQYIKKVEYDGSYEQLMNQKYLALFWVGFEAWSEYRRTGYPLLTISKSTMNDHILPRRFQYPINTAKTNPDNYRTAVENLIRDYNGNDDMKTPVWWSKKGIEQKK